IAPDRRARLTDGEVALTAYEKWADDAPRRIYGDWAFAAWHPDERKLFVARDHHGNTGLYYHAADPVFAFAPSRGPLRALRPAPRELDQRRLAQTLLPHPPAPAGRPCEKSIHRLPPAHAIIVTPGHFQVRRHWHLEQAPELRLSCRQEYVEAFRR